jgi:hypothetical protein
VSKLANFTKLLTHLSQLWKSRLKQSNCRCNTAADADHSQCITQTCSFLTGQTSQSTDAAQGRRKCSKVMSFLQQCILCKSPSTYRVSGLNSVRVCAQKSSGRNCVQVIVLRRICWSFKHVQHPFCNHKTAANVDGRKETGAQSQSLSGTGRHVFATHEAQSSGSGQTRNSISDGHQRRVK